MTTFKINTSVHIGDRISYTRLSDYVVEIKIHLPYPSRTRQYLIYAERSEDILTKIKRELIHRKEDAVKYYDNTTNAASKEITADCIKIIDECLDSVIYAEKTECNNIICNCCNQIIEKSPIEDRWGGYICTTCNDEA